MRVGVLFRGPLRPSVKHVLDNRDRLLDNFNDRDWSIETWLTTWSTWCGQNMIKDLPMDSFDAIISQPEPDPHQANELLKVSRLPSSQTANRVWKTMLSAKVAIDAMVQSNRYDYIVHARTDGLYDLKPYVDEWFRHDVVATKHVWPRINDFLQIGPSDLIHKVWDYGTVEDLRAVASNSESPESILEQYAEVRGVRFAAARCKTIWLDRERQRGDNMQ